MKRHYLFSILALLLLPYASGAVASDVDRWDFDVYLDDKKVGSHLFEVREVDGIREVLSEARFKVTVLKIPVYRYQHSSEERWQGDCLLDISASTNANGTRLRVLGEQQDQVFQIDAGEERAELPQCVMTFAYWNPSFLDEPQLLNPQTGEYLNVGVENAGEDELQVRGESIMAQRFTVKANGVDVTLWYSNDNQWLALESVAKGGRIIRYELS